MKVEAMLGVVVLISLALSIVSRRFRKFGLVIIAFAVLTIVAVIVLTKRSDPGTAAAVQTAGRQTSVKPQRLDFEQFHIEKLDKEDPDAKTRIAPSEIRFGQIRATPGPEAGTIESIRARLYNDSAQYTLTDYAYYLVVQDCVAAACTTVYDQRGRAAATVPSNQARDVTIAVAPGSSHDAPAFKLLGKPSILLTPTDTRAYRAEQLR